MNKLLSYKYYDTPEGQDIYLKTFVTTKYAAATGAIAATFDILLYSHPKGFVNTAGRMLYIAGPIMGMAAAFSVTTNVAQNFRGINDKWNYFLGGAVSGGIFSAWMRSGAIAVPAALVLGAAAVIKKSGVDDNWIFFPDVPQSTKSIQSVRHDWTLVKDVDELKTWVGGSK